MTASSKAAGKEGATKAVKIPDWVSRSFSRMLEGLPVPYFAIDRGGHITQWCSSMREVGGAFSALDPSKMVGQRLSDLVVGENERLRHALAAAIAGEVDSVSVELRLPMGNDEVIAPIVFGSFPRWGEPFDPVGGWCICKPAPVEQSLPPSVRIDAESQSMVMHELRSPLHGIKGLTRTLAQDESPQQKPLKLIENCAETILENVTNLLDCWALSGSSVRFSMETVDIKELMQKELLRLEMAVDKAGNPLRKPEVKLEENIAEVPPIEGDPQWLSQLLHHLAVNAYRFTQKGFIRFGLCACDDGQSVRISVQDTGIGIQREHFDRIRQAYQQEDSTDSRSYDGIGLGLAICCLVAEKHRGNINIESEKGVGSIFTAVLPIRQPDRSVDNPGNHHSKERVLPQHMTAGAKSLVMHELSSPLHGIVGVAQSLAQDPSPLKKPLAMISNSAASVLANITNLLDYWALADHAAQLAFETLDIQHIIRQEINRCEAATDKQGRPLKKKTVQVEFEVQEDIPCIEMDLKSMSQLIHHLLTNALKFTQKGKVKLSVRALQNLEKSEDAVEIVVEDTGVGIHDKDIQVIFGPYRQVDPSVSCAHGGIGVGLAICLEVVKLHKGRLEAESTKGAGSTFRVVLPRKQLRVTSGMVAKVAEGDRDDEGSVMSALFAVVDLAAEQDTASSGSNGAGGGNGIDPFSAFFDAFNAEFHALAEEYVASYYDCIGSCYVYVARGNSSEPVDRTIKFCIALENTVHKVKAEVYPDANLRVGFGIHSVDTVADLGLSHLGSAKSIRWKRFSNPAVRGARQIGELAMPGSILLSPSTHTLLSDETKEYAKANDMTIMNPSSNENYSMVNASRPVQADCQQVNVPIASRAHVQPRPSQDAITQTVPCVVDKQSSGAGVAAANLKTPYVAETAGVAGSDPRVSSAINDPVGSADPLGSSAIGANGRVPNPLPDPMGMPGMPDPVRSGVYPGRGLSMHPLSLGDGSFDGLGCGLNVGLPRDLDPRITNNISLSHSIGFDPQVSIALGFGPSIPFGSTAGFPQKFGYSNGLDAGLIADLGHERSLRAGYGGGATGRSLAYDLPSEHGLYTSHRLGADVGIGVGLGGSDMLSGAYSRPRLF
eukprot:TRINITY_DN23736_c0_g1_i1.p1 TRINITY_DN23736_c0_g1~~TRINITY_DN23736_c0_g1_i1.p1  ORF type:complete len:1153 (-),score=203.51 TRINITY_DN23736_c0_g1_i1:75-3425(-)